MFFLAAYVFTWLCWVPLAFDFVDWERHAVLKELLTIMGQFGPFASAILVAAIEGRSLGVGELLRKLLFWRVNSIWFLFALLFPPASWLLALGIKGLFGGDIEATFSRNPWSTLPLHFLSVLLLGGPLGEELGWRGFALPRLQQIANTVLASVILALVWAVWHLPLWWIAEVPSSFGFYVVGIIPLTYLFSWLTNCAKGSVLVSMIFHASLNTSLARWQPKHVVEIWTALLWIIAIILFACERQRKLKSLAQSQ